MSTYPYVPEVPPNLKLAKHDFSKSCSIVYLYTISLKAIIITGAIVQKS